jgi:hypothetical protein
VLPLVERDVSRHDRLAPEHDRPKIRKAPAVFQHPHEITEERRHPVGNGDVLVGEPLDQHRQPGLVDREREERRSVEQGGEDVQP